MSALRGEPKACPETERARVGCLSQVGMLGWILDMWELGPNIDPNW